MKERFRSHLGAVLFLIVIYSILLLFLAPKATVIGGALICAPCMYFLLANLYYLERSRRTDYALIQRAVAGQPFENGQWVAAVGPIVAVDAPLKTPFQQRDCVAYTYLVNRWERGRRTHQTYFTGEALTAAVIQTGQGPVKLLGYVDLRFFTTHQLTYEAAHQNAQMYIAATVFEEVVPLKTGSLTEMEATFTAHQDQFRRDRRWMPDPINLTPEHKFYETFVEVGQEVCALGIYSAEKGGLVDDLQGEFHLVRQLRLIPGNAAAASQTLVKDKKAGVVLGLLLVLSSHCCVGGQLIWG